ncbi:IucA/IucC family protein [Halorussus pelagicus]|uniref:IucA/IucC family protein n=1 Tax=Halorussus pelagicus TaxID=2505977 RepID=UPI000FFB60FE|nr:IucA/IucC family protein [Halorussus pelagicus]
MTTVGEYCETPAEHAESATLHAVLNCYLRETDAGTYEATAPSGIDAPDGVVRLELPEQDATVVAPLRYRSATGRHLFELPAYTLDGESPTSLDAGTLAALVRRELALGTPGADLTEGTDLLRRVFASRRATERFVRDREWDIPADLAPEFIETEQSLVYGHQMHPTPKSREGVADHEVPTYAPELGGEFRLRYFAADPAVVTDLSARPESAAEWVASALRESDADLPPEAADALNAGRVLVPTHPWQADYLAAEPHVEAALKSGRLDDLGQFGPTFYPTSSVRTLWSPDAPFMVKGSLAVQITNSERTTKRAELRQGVLASRLVDAEFGDLLAERFPRFTIVEDPAALALDIGEDSESGFETVLRENPFRGADAERVAPVAALCQDRPDGPSLLARVVRRLAADEGRPEEEAAREWFRKYLAVTLRPTLWSYFELGVGFEAHQQNTLVELDSDGWPTAGYYRDNEGFYFPESRYDRVEEWVPGLREQVDMVCADDVADECIRYYTVVNNAFGVVNALGVAGLTDETALLEDLRAELSSLAEYEPPESSLVSALLERRRIPCKANLLTRFEGRDELAFDLENESVYVDIDNPLVTRLDAASGREDR